jgi:integrator complex subunit 3
VQEQDEVNLGLVYGILTNTAKGIEFYHLLTLVCQDGMILVIQNLEQLIMEKFHKLLQIPKKQVLWLTGEMIKGKVRDSERLVFALLKQIKGGDPSTDNIWLVEAVLSILIENKPWLLAQPHLISSVLYTYLCLIAEHCNPSLQSLQQEEVSFCIELLRERFVDCIEIGKELVRLLQNVARIPEFTQLWKDILHNPEVLAPGFKGVSQLMKMRTSRRFISSRLTADMEIKMQFIALQVKFGMQKKYQEWFQKKYLSQPSCQFYIADLIRYLCCVIHPPNEVLSSDIIPRWALVGWLLSLCQSSMAASMAKLALFFDFLCYDSEDQTMIMNIEPAMLVMYYSLRTHPLLTSTLLDFLCRIVPNFHPKFEVEIRLCVVAALQDVVQKGVLQSLKPLFENERLDEDLRAFIKKTFPEFFSVDQPRREEPMVDDSEKDRIELEGEDPEIAALTWREDNPGEELPQSDPLEADTAANNGDSTNESEEEGEEGMEVEEAELDVMWRSEWDDIVLPPKMTDSLHKLKDSFDKNERSSFCELFSSFLDLMKESEGSKSSTLHFLVDPVWFLTREYFDSCPLKSLTETMSLSEPAYILCRKAISGAVLPVFLAKLAKLQPKLGVCLLTYLSVFGEKQNVFESKLSIYQTVAKLRYPNEENPVIKSVLVDCQEHATHDQDGFIELVPVLSQELSDAVTGRPEFVQLVVSSCNPFHLHQLICELMMRNFYVFGSNSQKLQETIRASLEWDTFEQYCVWQMMMAESPNPTLVTPLLQEIEAEVHPEASTGIILFLSSVTPSIAVVESVLKAQVSVTTTAILSHWMSVQYLAMEEAIKCILSHDENDKVEMLLKEHFGAIKASAPNCGVTGLSRHLPA